MRHIAAVGALVLLFGGTACATKKPVLYPNDTYNAVGAAAAREDVDDCIALAKGGGLEGSKTKKTAKNTATSAATGGAVGAAAGAVVGRPGTGAAAAAAGSGAGAIVRGVFDSDEPDPLLKRYVEICLRERGYRVLGWR